MILLLALFTGCTEYELSQSHDPALADGDASDPYGGDPWAPPDEDAPPSTGIPLEPHGPLRGGHFDAETTSFLAPLWHGSVDGHVHEYDERYEVGGVDYFDVKHGDLRNIDEVITNPEQRFKLIVANPDLSPGARLVINRAYNPPDKTTWHAVGDYAAIPLNELPIFSLGGVEGTYPLVDLGLYFDEYAIEDRELVPTDTDCVVANIPGVGGTWRNGAITLQAVAVDEWGVLPPTDHALSAGGVHGVATGGLLFEATVFWHWKGPCSHEDGWEDHEPKDGGGGGGGGGAGGGPPD